MNATYFTVVVTLACLWGADALRVKRDAWRTWEGVEVNCDSSPKGNPCVKCACQKVGTFGDKDYNSCREDTTHCYGHKPCADSVVKPGECCPSCPNGANCMVYGSIVQPSEEKIFKQGSDSEYKICGAGGLVKTCTITTTHLGSSYFQRHYCQTPYGG